MTNEQLKRALTTIATRVCWSDDPEFMVDDYAGGNVDDAYYGGSEDGRAQLARELLDDLFGISVTK